MNSYPLNRLRCPNCKCFRETYQYPFVNDGLRHLTCEICQRRSRKQYVRAKRVEQEQELGDLESQYCSGCNQPREETQFEGFRVCIDSAFTMARYSNLYRWQLRNLNFDVGIKDIFITSSPDKRTFTEMG